MAWIIAAMTMTLGNTVALTQENLKRLLAYSSIAHAGYLMIGVAVAFAYVPVAGVGLYLGTEGILFYLVAYALMTLGAFGVIIALSTRERPIETVEDLSGLSQSHPLTGAGDGALSVQPGGNSSSRGLLRQVPDPGFGICVAGGRERAVALVAGGDRGSELGRSALTTICGSSW